MESKEYKGKRARKGTHGNDATYDDTEVKEQIENINTEQAIQNNKIETLETENEDLRNMLPYSSASGENITFEDSAELYLKNIQLNGNSKQKTSIFNGQYCPPVSEWTLYNGAVLEADGYISLPNDNSYAEVIFEWNKAGDWGYLFMTTKADDDYNVLISCSYLDKDMKLVNSNAGNGNNTDKIAGESIYRWAFGSGMSSIYGEALQQATYVRLVVRRGTEFGTVPYKFKDVTVGTTKYIEPYVDTIPNSPSPKCPSEIKCCKNNINVTVCSKNLLTVDNGTVSQNGVTMTINNGEIILNGTSTGDIWFTVNPKIGIGTPSIGSKYIFNNSYYVFSAFLEGDYSINTATYVGFNVNTNNSTKMVRMNNENSYLLYKQDKLINCFVRFYEGDTFNNTKLKIQIEKGKVVTDYERHQEQNFTFPLVEGQALRLNDYLADDGIHHRRKEIVLEGTENVLLEQSTLSNVKRFYIKGFSNASTTYNGQSSHFKYIGNYSLDDEHMYVTNGGFLYIFAKFETTAELKAYLAQQKQAGTPVTIEYELETEEVENYNEEQQEAWNEIKKAKSYEGITHIYSTDEISPVFNVEAFKSIKEYDDTEIKTKMTEIENTVGSMATTLDNINGEVVENVNSQ